ncbi:glycerol dehydrogenase-like oxidoreductase [Aciduliprofundum sp. MAR08-339]|uniref:NAD(P)-dependent glycerol-1-phosphate dehydrogenase n=1 Tax=Aciduliprofundum sp. (strain MAR08-339) TaxID=673860 RepID=UPI0002A4A924|nr:glycerol dehydrogenase-like oxidoreductase [Aciduliprofundum sp. MAR08-339]
MSFEKSKWTQLPREIYAGHGVLEQVGPMCRRFGFGENALIVTGSTSYEVAGKRVKELLEDSGFNVEVHITDKASVENLERVKDHAHDSNFLVGVGGGSKIDLAKKASYDLGMHFISVPTIATHDGIASPRASIRENGTTVSMDAQEPMGIVADTEILIQAPYRYLAAGAADVIGNITAIKDWELAHKLRNEEFSSTAYGMAKYSAEFILENADAIKPNLEESAWIVVKSIMASGMAMSIAHSSRPASGSEHLFAHALEKIAPGKALHGEMVGVGTIMMMYLHGGDWLRVRNALKAIGAPVTARELGVEEEDIIEALTNAHRMRNRYTILGMRGLTEEAARNLARITGVVGR